MDYDSRIDGDAGLTGEGGESANLVAGIAAAMQAAARSGGTPLLPDANGVVVLPEGATLDDLRVQGRDLVIQLADGRIFVIPDGAVYVPQIMVAGVTIPPLNLAALLTGNEPQPAAGPPRSSGGNFADPNGPIQDAFNLGDLLPYTELAFPQRPDREIIPHRPDRPVTINIAPPGNSVNEAGLPARGAEPPGSNSAANSETTTGNIIVVAPDGLASVTINGVTITGVGQTIVTPRGVLTITSINGNSIGYSYTLTDNTSGDNTSDSFNIVATDTDGDVANAVLTIAIIDDVPTARNDTDAVAAGTYGPETGNVITGTGTTSGAAGADTQGADAATLTGFRAGTSGAFGAAGSTIAGTYGTLTLNANGSYSYTRNAGTPGGVTDTFSYQITDGDGDTSTATLVISIADATPITAANATVLLDDDALAGGNPGGVGDDANAANTAGTLGASGGDGPLVWSLLTTGAPVGFSFVANGTGIDVFQGTTKVLVITLNTATGAYTVTQIAPIVHPAGSDENNQGFTLSYRVTDVDGDTASGSLAISVDDDTPTVSPQGDIEINSLFVDESTLPDSDTNNYSGLFTHSFGADGPGTVAYSLGVIAGPSGLVDSLTGENVILSMNGGVVEGRTAIGGLLVFTVSVTASGDVTLTQLRAIIHDPNFGPNDAESVINDRVTLTQTVTDSDGDAVSATINFGDFLVFFDDAPTTSANATVQLDDDALAGGNPGGTGDDPDAVNVSGMLSGSGNDGPLTWTAFSYIPTLGMTATLVNPGLVEVYQGATKILSITLNNATGAYTVTQHAPIDHTALGDENNGTFQLNYHVTDADGDIAAGSLLINIDDDTPLAANDTDALLAGATGPATGNVLTDADAGDAGDGDTGADSLGADGGTVTAISGSGGAGTIGGATAGTHGTLTMNADGSYSYTRSGTGPINATDVFTYTVTDGDGDTATATLTITLQDAAPITGANALVQLDDDALAGGNPGGTGDDPDAVNVSGTLTGSGGDGVLTWTAFSYVPTLGMTATLVNPGLVEVYQGATKILSITLNNATGAYTVTQHAPIDHAALGDENNGTFQLNYHVTDADGDVAAGSLLINIDDDTPLTANDTDSLLAGATGPATGNVLTDASAGDTGDGDTGADSLGADGGTVTAISGSGGAGTIGGATAGTHGTLTMNADGSYSYTRSGTGPINATDVFTYTVTDGDGDTATATLTITLQDAAPITGANALVQLDDDALAGGNPGGTGDDPDAVNVSGTLTGSGGDGVLTWTAFSYVPTLGMTATLVNPGLVEVYQGATKILSITLNNATGAYTVTQHAPIDHSVGGDENNGTFQLNYHVTDADGDIAAGSLIIDLDDDTPLAANDTDSLLAGATGPATGNVLTDADAGDAGDGDTGADSLGADGGTVTAISGSGGAGTIGGATAGTHGTLTMNADGSYSYTRSGTGAINATDVFTYTVTDGDGDTVTATLTITLQDAVPITGANATVQVDDDALAGGNPGGTGDDPDAVNVSGTLAGSGGDGTLTWTAFSYVPTLGMTASLINPGLIHVFQGATHVLTITLNNATGAYTVTQLAPIDHSAAGDENNATFQLNYHVTDADGDIAAGSIIINMDDDTPVVADDTDLIAAGGMGPATGNVLTDADAGDAGDTDTGADSLGADGGTVTAISGFGGAGVIGGSTNGQYGVLTLNADGSYSYTRNTGTPGNVTDVFTYTVTDGDGDTATATLTITIQDAIPITGANANVQLDDDALAGGNPGGTGDDPDAVNVSGTLSGSGGDGTLTWTAFSYVPTLGMTASLINPGLIHVFQGATHVLTITLNNATGAYTVTQLAQIDHSAGGDENNATFQLNYHVTDADGDFAAGSLVIDLDDDTPLAANDTDSLLAGATGPATGNVLTDADPGDTGDGDTGADSLGADGGTVTAISGSGGAGTIGGSTTGTHGTLTMNADGSYSYTRSGTGPINATDVFTYTVTDGDGDTVTATLTITLQDAAPLTGANATVQLDDDALAGGNPGGTGDDPDAVNVSGTLAGSGGDGTLTWTAFSYVPTLGMTASLINPGLIHVFQGATHVLTITLNNATGAYTVTQLAPIDHSAGGDENNATFQLNYNVTDADGDVAGGSLIINMDDDTPLTANDTDSLLAGATGPATGNVLTDADPGDTGDGDTGADSLGADGGTVTGISGSGGAGTIGGSTTGTHGTLTMNADGSYSYTRSGTGPINATDVFTYTVTDGDGDTATATLTITLQDAAPLTGANANVQLDDDALAGGNPGGTGDDPDAVNVSGTLAGSGGDGTLTWTAFSYVPTLGMTASLINPGLIHVFQGATHVLTITLNNATGAYTVTQLAPIDHSAGGDENNATFQLNYHVTDADGDFAAGSLVIDLDDDTPLTADDTDSLLAGATGPATGNVLTDADAGDAGDGDTGADSLGADGGTVTGISGSGGAGTIGGSTTGTHGTLTMNADGSYSYTRSGTGPINATDVFTYTVTDGDGDTATATLTITLQDAAPLTGANATVQLDDDALAGGNPGGTGDDPDAVNVSGTLAGSGGDGTLTWTAFSYVPTLGMTASLINPGLIHVFQGATHVLTITLNNATGAYTVTQLAPIDHSAGGDENNATFQLNYNVTDADGDVAGGSIIIDMDDDTPLTANDTDSLLAGATGPATGNVLTDADPGDTGDGDTGADSLGADGGTVTGISGSGGAGTIGGSTTGTHGTLTMNADGSYSYTRSGTGPINATDVFTYTVTDGDGDTATATLTITLQDAAPLVGANANVQVDDDALAGGIAGGTGDDPDAVNISGTLSGSGGDGALTWTAFSYVPTLGMTASLINPGLIHVFQGATHVLTITLNNATGAYTVTQLAAIDHTALGDENNTTFQLNYNVTDADGDVAGGSLIINMDDDTPVAIVPTAISLTNAAGAPVLASLDADLTNNYGADGGTPRFAPSLNGANSGMTSGTVPIIYTVSPDGLTLTGHAGATLIFTVTLLPGTNQYSVDMDGVVDSLVTLNFASGAYQFVGGNTAWVGFVPLGQDTTGGAINDNSKDLMITPSIGGLNAGTINGSSVALGVGSGNAVDAGEMVRLDFVTDLTGNTAGPGGYGVAGNRDHSFDGHYTTNGASALITASSGSTVKFTAKDDFDANTVVGDGTIDPITKIVIAYNSVTSAFIIPTTTLTNYIVNGITYGVILNADGSVSISNVQGTSGAGAIGTQVAIYTANGYSSLEIAHQAGSDFKLGNFGTVVQSTNPVNFTLPVEVIDGDGDVSASANLAITLTAPVVPPVVLDLDGDGAEFLAASAGVMFDYDGDGVRDATAWAGSDDGLLAIDLNGDGVVNNGAELVFGGAGQTDLEGLAAKYDSNGDGTLTAADAAFAQFGVWQDADSDGVTDAGEFRSLAEMGIASISLTSDGVAYTAAGGDVTVSGQSTYTRADGSTGIVADAGFVTSAQARQMARSVEMVSVAAASLGLISSIDASGGDPMLGDLVISAGRTLGISGELTDSLQTVTGERVELEALDGLFEPTARFELEMVTGRNGLGDERFLSTDIELEPLFDRIVDSPLTQPGDSLTTRFASGDLFQGPTLHVEQAMEALLLNGGPGLGDQIAEAGQRLTDLPQIREALAEAQGENFVDQLVSRLAGDLLGEGGGSVLDDAGLLDLMGASAGPELGYGLQSIKYDPFVEGHELAAVQA